eukprot:TRINITY_DN21284_c0_g1_i1.p1 TRINITY_DN21284_c0_g1~~TRINITY_DN21284_c0_g1_i1.p1  ORF type:complete len:111 (-),score=24.79 TRINITY_DN21284_c0_g1_i1:363-695(-)
MHCFSVYVCVSVQPPCASPIKSQYTDDSTSGINHSVEIHLDSNSQSKHVRSKAVKVRRLQQEAANGGNNKATGGQHNQEETWYRPHRWGDFKHREDRQEAGQMQITAKQE